jgi:hypothetical protein
MKSTASQDGIRAELERQADLARARLLGTLDAIDKRRHELFDVRMQLRRHGAQIRFGAAAVLTAAFLASGLRALSTQRRRDRMGRERLRAAGRLWRHPERLALRRRPLWETIAANVVIAIVAFAAAEATWQVVDGRRRLPRAPLPPVEEFGV